MTKGFFKIRMSHRLCVNVFASFGLVSLCRLLYNEMTPIVLVFRPLLEGP